MKKLLNNKQIYTIIQAEEETGTSRLIFDLTMIPGAKVYCEVSKSGVININTWEIKGK